SLTITCTAGSLSTVPVLTPNPCNPPTITTGLSLGTCSSITASGSSCTLSLLSGYSVQSGQLTLGCTAQVLDAIPIVTPNPCSVPLPISGTHAGNCSAVIPSGSRCDLTILSGWSCPSSSS